MVRLLVPALVLAMTLPFATGCNQTESIAQDGPEKKKEPRDQFASDQVKETDKAIPFDSTRAMGYLKEICDLGPRLSGSDGMQKQQVYLKKHFEDLGAKVTMQRFSARQVSRPTEEVSMANMIVTWHPDRDRRIIFCSHYDTRPIADQEPSRRDWNKPFVSANDGASGAAWMMELAHQMKDLPAKVGVDFILFDGEEYIFERDRDKYFIGSDYFASEYRKEKPKHKYVAGVLLDLFAGKNARYPLEQKSAFYAGAVQDSIWKIARELKVPAFQNRRGSEVLDDHIALNEIGIPTVDIIDFDYPHWHRLTDTPDQCTGESMEQVARVLMTWVQRIK